jgi:nitroimidazol reductase NimA-like FMN-containing flavoprotein (pyridoxamine 5'-phosphate oxidase superfamily)
MTARETIDTVPFLTLATVDQQGQPWATPLAYSFDPRGLIYWRSGKDSQHSRNIRDNGRVFITVFDSSKQPGLYLQGSADEVSDLAEIEHALAIDRHRQFAEPSSAYQGNHPRRYYRADLVRVWNVDGEEGGRFVDIRREIPLSDLTGDPS